jgi:ribosomal protein S27E
MTMSQDCYFFYDDSLPKDKQFIHAMCVGCYNKETPRHSVKTWRWSAKSGYGKQPVKCWHCGTVIHQEGNAEDKNTPAL